MYLASPSIIRFVTFVCLFVCLFVCVCTSMCTYIVCRPSLKGCSIKRYSTIDTITGFISRYRKRALLSSVC